MAAASLFFPFPAHGIKAIMLEMARGIHELMLILVFCQCFEVVQ